MFFCTNPHDCETSVCFQLISPSLSRLSPVLSLHSQIQPVLRAKDIEPYTAPCWWPLPGCGQQPKEEGSPAPEFQPWPRPQSNGSQTQRCPRQGASPADRAQSGCSGDGERAGLLFPEGNQASLECNKPDPHDRHTRQHVITVYIKYSRVVLNASSLKGTQQMLNTSHDAT